MGVGFSYKLPDLPKGIKPQRETSLDKWEGFGTIPHSVVRSVKEEG